MPPWEPRSEQHLGADLLFDAYEEVAPARDTPRAQFGIGRTGNTVVLVEGVAGGLRARRVTPADSIRALGDRLRQGFKPLTGHRFFNPRSGEFSLIHPDLCWKGARVVLLSRQGEQLQVAAERVAALAGRAPSGCIRSEEVAAWLTQQARHAAHVVVFDDHPIWALALGELVHDHCWDWRAGPKLAAPPPVRPSAHPVTWAQWLRQCFSDEPVRSAQAGFGVAPQGLSKPADQPVERAGLSALL